jgi:hypothetical protein
MTFAHDPFETVTCEVVSYLATVQNRAPSASREDRKMVLVDLDACDGSIAIDQSDSFVDKTCYDGERFSLFSILGCRNTPDVSYLSTENFQEGGRPSAPAGQGRKII